MGAGQPPSCPYPIVTIGGALSLTSAPGTALPPSLVGISSLNSYSRPLEGPHQIMSDHTPRFRARSDGVSQHSLTQRTLFFFKTEKPNHFLFQHTVPSISPSLTPPVGCTLSHGFLPVVPPLLHLLAPRAVPSLAPCPHPHTHVLALTH